MELKYIQLVNDYCLFKVLIVPLWNWNVGTNIIAGADSEGSNRTFMELK